MESKVAYLAGTVLPTIDSFVDVRARGGEGWLMFRYDPTRDLIEWRKGNHIEVVDLKQFK